MLARHEMHEKSGSGQRALQAPSRAEQRHVHSKYDWHLPPEKLSSVQRGPKHDVASFEQFAFTHDAHGPTIMNDVHDVTDDPEPVPASTVGEPASIGCGGCV